MTTLRRCIELLERKGIQYNHTRHANAYRALEVASAECMPSQMLAKTVIFCADTWYAMAVLPADCMLDLDELAVNVGAAHLRLATEEEIGKLFPDSEVGAMPPLGALYNLPVYVDEHLAYEQYIAFNAGTHRDAIHMKFADYLGLTDPLIRRFARSEVKIR